jgi:hypothetical protein
VIVLAAAEVVVVATPAVILSLSRWILLYRLKNIIIII